MRYLYTIVNGKGDFLSSSVSIWSNKDGFKPFGSNTRMYNNIGRAEYELKNAWRYHKDAFTEKYKQLEEIPRYKLTPEQALSYKQERDTMIKAMGLHIVKLSVNIEKEV